MNWLYYLSVALLNINSSVASLLTVRSLDGTRDLLESRPRVSAVVRGNSQSIRVCIVQPNNGISLLELPVFSHEIGHILLRPAPD